MTAAAPAIAAPNGLLLAAIGRVRTPWLRLQDCPRGVRGVQESARLEISPAFSDALLGIEQASHLHVLYWLGEADRTVLRRPTPHDGVVRGVFATRSPMRPNPLGLAVVRLLHREKSHLVVSGLDCLDGTPLIDIKPYLPQADCVPGATLAWQPAPVPAPAPAP